MSGNEAAAAAACPPERRGKLLRRSNSDRLRMHAPSSIEVVAPAAAAAGGAAVWKQAIPLLSPLDLDLTPWHLPPELAKPPKEDRASAVEAEVQRGKWEHPAAPFYYEPVPSNAAPFVSS